MKKKKSIYIKKYIVLPFHNNTRVGGLAYIKKIIKYYKFWGKIYKND